MCSLLRRDDGAAGRAAGRLLPNALCRVLRGPEVAPRDLVAVHRQPVARRVRRARARRTRAEPLLREQDSQAAAEGRR